LAEQPAERDCHGGDFAIQAVSFSADQGSLPDGGNLGWVTSGMMVPEFDQAIFSRPRVKCL
jgi:peptidyl-prolyl cis-trans isomerase SurA